MTKNEIQSKKNTITYLKICTLKWLILLLRILICTYLRFI
jgi:hypothetical protein